jgi:hypothetical protein
MTDPTATMQTAYYSKLTTPAIIYAGHTVRVYSDFAPSNAKAPYIILGAQTLIDNSNKTTFGSDFTQAVTVVDVTDASVTGSGAVTCRSQYGCGADSHPKIYITNRFGF